MADRPALKLKLSSAKNIKQQSSTTSPTPTSAVPKLKLSLKNPQSPATSRPPLPASADKKVTKSGRKSKATPKKRELDEIDSGDESEPLAQRKKIIIPAVPEKKTKLRAPSNQTIRVVTKGSKPYRPLGVGYDSEDEGRESDPNVDNDFILRMMPGDDCEYLRKAIADNNFQHTKDINGEKKREKGADVRIKFLTRDCRRALVIIQARYYAAILVDLPSIIEAMKSWNKKDFYKSADVHQMLYILGPCKNEEDALKYPLPASKAGFDEKTWQWAHGITPPMRWARKRRFRKRLSTRVVEEDEQEVERLLQADAEAISSKYRHLNDDMLDREEGAAIEDSEDDEEDAEGELDDDEYTVTHTQQMEILPEIDENDEDLEAHFEREMAKAAEEGEAADTNLSTINNTTATNTNKPPTTNILPANVPLTDSPVATPDSSSFVLVGGPLTPAGAMSSEAPESDSEHLATGTGPSAGASSPDRSHMSSSDDDDDDDDDDDNESGGAVDEDVLERQQDLQRQREEIADLEGVIAREEQKLAATGNAILRQKIGRTILALRNDLEVKRGAMGGRGDEEGRGPGGDGGSNDGGGGGSGGQGDGRQ